LKICHFVFLRVLQTTSKTIYKAGYGPLLPGIFVAPFPYHYHDRLRYGDNYTEEQSVKHALEDINILLKTQTSPSETAAMLIEPVLGEGGYVPAPASFLQGLRELCTKHNILLIIDEVQSGFGRTGSYFAIEHSKVTPDVLIFAKGVASGLPLSGIVSTRELMSKQPAGSMGGTFAGNALSCSAAIATLDVFKEENIFHNVIERGKQLTAGLLDLQKKFPCIGDIRGPGLMIGVQFKWPTAINNQIVKYCLEEGMLLLTCSIFDTLRFIPPLNVTAEEIDVGLSIFERAMQKVTRGNKE